MADEDECLYFGIGCLYFTARPGQDLSWEEAVKESLNSLARVSDVEVDLGVLLDAEAQAPAGWYPTRGMLRFHLYIPLEEQKELHELLRHVPLNAEYFVVMVHFRYFEPVAFILPQGAPSNDGTSAAVVVREYLHREFSRQELPAVLHVIGPTPFHADLCVRPAAIDKDFELVRTPGRGYDEFAFLYSRDSFSSVALAAVTLFDNINDELSLFYSMLTRRADRLRERHELLALVQNLIQIYQAKGFTARTRRVFTSSTRIRRVALKAVNAEYQSQDDEQTLHEQMDELYSARAAFYFKDYLESEVASHHTAELLAAKEMVSLLDQARQRQIEVTSLFLSAIAGGLAGTLVSLLIH